MGKMIKKGSVFRLIRNLRKMSEKSKKASKRKG